MSPTKLIPGVPGCNVNDRQIQQILHDWISDKALDNYRR